MKVFEKGNVAIGKAAIAAGCRFYVGYPITPQNDVPEYMSKAMPENGRIFLQSNSELEASNLLLGAAGAGARAMASTSGPGMTLYAEGLSFMGGMEIPGVVIDVARPGPAMGGIDAAQMDYLYCTKAAGNGGTRCFCMSPDNIQELVDQVYKSFDIAEKYRCPVIILTDTLVAQTFESVEIPEARPLDQLPDNREWDITWRASEAIEDQRTFASLQMPISLQEDLCNRLAARYAQMEREDVEWEEYKLDDAEFVIFAYGGMARIAKAAINMLREEGIKAGLFRPITLYPFPTKQIRALDFGKFKGALDVELSPYGMMLEDVERAVQGKIKIEYMQRSGGFYITPDVLAQQVKTMLERS